MNAFFRKAFLPCSTSVALLLILAGAGCSGGRQYHPSDASVPDAVGDRPSSTGGARSGGAGGSGGGAGLSGGAGGKAGAGGGGGGTGASLTGGLGGPTGGSTTTGGEGGGPATKIATGLECKSDGECDSGHCASGVCCKDACTGSCMACTNALTVSLADGTCGPVGSGVKDPNGSCAADATTCGKTGFCDGKGQCELRGSTTSCGTASCGGGSYTPAAHCDGKGVCGAVTPQDCKGFTCSAAGGCAITCSADTECTGGYCAALASGATSRNCAPKKGDGVACSGDNQCTNGHCVSGICCQSACTTKCYACSKAATGQDDGLCKPVSAGGASQGMCTTSGGECGQDGSCDGNGGCRLAKQGTSCGTKAAACTAGNMSSAAPVCNGAGTCASPSSQACGGFTCNTATGTCKQAPCSGDGDCVAGNYCNGASCVPKKSPGGGCGAQHECANGTCSADGHCCDTACTGSCLSCSSGTCAAKSGNPDTNHACNSACVDLTSDPKNCGMCGKACSGGTHCSSSQCICDNSDTSCGTGGACTNCAQTGKMCQSGQCQCPSTKPLICNNTCTASDSSNCGSCGKSCGVGGSCVSGSCCSKESSNNQLTNAGFDTSLTGWAVYGSGVVTQWARNDADGCPNSGSALLTGADILYQCIPATAGLLYSIGVHYKGDLQAAPSFNVMFVSDCSTANPFSPPLDIQKVDLPASANWTASGNSSFTAPSGTSGLLLVFYAGGNVSETTSYDQPYVTNGFTGSF